MMMRHQLSGPILMMLSLSARATLDAIIRSTFFSLHMLYCLYNKVTTCSLFRDTCFYIYLLWLYYCDIFGCFDIYWDNPYLVGVVIFGNSDDAHISWIRYLLHFYSLFLLCI